MSVSPQLHHVAKRIAPQSLEKVLEVFKLLNCEVTYRPDAARWAMVGQKDLFFDIQLVEVDEKPMHDKSRKNSHIAFISDNPTAEIEKVERWSLENGVRFEKGSWKEKELWFDFPEVFVDFVIEVMHISVVQE